MQVVVGSRKIQNVMWAGHIWETLRCLLKTWVLGVRHAWIPIVSLLFADFMTLSLIFGLHGGIRVKKDTYGFRKSFARLSGSEHGLLHFMPVLAINSVPSEAGVSP